MEKFFLCTFFSYNKLYIVNQKYIIITVLVPESSHCKFISCFTNSDRIDQFVGKCLTGYIKHLFGRILLQNIMSNWMHQMRFSQSYTSVKEERIVDFSRWFGYRKGSSMGEIIVSADNERIKGIFRIEIRLLGNIINSFVFWFCFWFFLSGIQIIFHFIECHLRIRNIFWNKFNIIFHTGYFSNTYFERKKILILYMFNAGLEVDGQIQSISYDVIYFKGSDPCFKGYIW